MAAFVFQLTRPRGARHALAPNGALLLLVSTHAPARGATRRPARTPGRGSRFNSRAREGRDECLGVRPLRPLFQLTRPRGARLTRSEIGFGKTLFQLTRPRGARPGFGEYAYIATSFNSRAREGRDLRRLRSPGAPHSFQLTRPRGARHRSLRHDGGRDVVSTHAPARGATATCRFAKRVCMFQLTRPRGARRGGAPAVRQRGGFNSRAREGRDC